MSYQLSPSALSLMKLCPRCFWWQVKKRIRKAEGIPQALAIQIDRILKKEFDFFRQKNELPPVLKELDSQNITLHERQNEIDWWRQGIECSLGDKNLVLFGKVDDALQKEGKLIPFDLKTIGKNQDNCTDEKIGESIEKYNYKLQLEFYKYVFEKRGFPTEDFGYLLFYFIKEFDSEGKAVFGTKLIRLKLEIKNVEEEIEKALQILNMEQPPEPGINEKGKKCEFCSSPEERHNAHLKEQEENQRIISEAGDFLL